MITAAAVLVLVAAVYAEHRHRRRRRDAIRAACLTGETPTGQERPPARTM